MIKIKKLEQAIGIPFPKWSHDCHKISQAILRTGLLGEARIARGCCTLVADPEHSWIVLGRDPYCPKALIVDPTLWSYCPEVKGIWKGPNLKRHFPMGYGDLRDGPKPQRGTGPTIVPTPGQPLSRAALKFIDMISGGQGLDLHGWASLMECNVGGWPASEIVEAMLDTKKLVGVVPIDLRGMLTNRLASYLWKPAGS